MKSTLLRTFFEWALITSVLMSLGFFVWFYTQSRAVRACNNEIANMQVAFQNNRAVVAQLLNECREYGRTNADMARLLEPPKPQTSVAPAAPAPVTKPKAK